MGEGLTSRTCRSQRGDSENKNNSAKYSCNGRKQSEMLLVLGGKPGEKNEQRVIQKVKVRYLLSIC